MLDKDVQFPGLNVSNEMIEPQLDDPVIPMLEKEYTKLISMADGHSNKLNNSSSFFKNKDTKSVIENIDKIINDRFGLNIQHVNGRNIGYAIIPVPPVNYNVIGGDIEERFEIFKEALGKGCSEDDSYCVPEVTDKTAKEKKYVKDYFSDETSILYHTYVSHLKLEEQLKGKGVKINLKKAKIENAPKDYTVFVIVDLHLLINVFNLTARELTGVLLHEVGHGFTHLEYSYRTVHNTSVIIDSLRSSMAKGKSTNDSLNLVYKTLGGDDDLTKVNNGVAAIKVLDRYMEHTLAMSKDDRHSYTDSEQLADQFAGRFGLSAEVVSGLNKLHGEHNRVAPSPLTIVIMEVVNVVFIIATLVLIPLLIPYFVLIFSLVLLVGGTDANAMVYDDKIRRYQRLRNEMIRMLRLTSIDKKTIKSILSELKLIDDIIKNASNDKSILLRLGDKLFPWNNRVSSFKKLEQLMEDMTDNNLYVASSKLKTL